MKNYPNSALWKTYGKKVIFLNDNNNTKYSYTHAPFLV